MRETSLALAFGATLVAPVMLLALLLELRAPAGPVEEPTEESATTEAPAVEAVEAADAAEGAGADEVDEPVLDQTKPARVGSMLATTWS